MCYHSVITVVGRRPRKWYHCETTFGTKVFSLFVPKWYHCDTTLWPDVISLFVPKWYHCDITLLTEVITLDSRVRKTDFQRHTKTRSRKRTVCITKTVVWVPSRQVAIWRPEKWSSRVVQFALWNSFKLRKPRLFHTWCSLLFEIALNCGRLSYFTPGAICSLK